MNNGWIKLHRSLMKWEWYKETGMVHLFLHLIMSACHKDTKWNGITIKKGQLVVGRKQLSLETGISENSIRTCITRLKSTSQITSKSTNRFSIITICNYDFYQSILDESNQQNSDPTHQQGTSKAPASHQQPTTYKNNKNIKKENNVEKLKKSIVDSDFENFNFFEIFHTSCPNLPKIQIQSETRKKMIASRISEFGEEKLLQVFKLAGESDFLNGKNDKNWSADLDWILKPANFIKILENKYKNKPQSHETFKPNDPRASQAKGWDIPL